MIFSVFDVLLDAVNICINCSLFAFVLAVLLQQNLFLILVIWAIYATCNFLHLRGIL